MIDRDNSPATGERWELDLRRDDDVRGVIVEVIGDVDGDDVSVEDRAGTYTFEVVSVPDDVELEHYEEGKVDTLLEAYFREQVE